jgi:hypothetical protein
MRELSAFLVWVFNQLQIQTLFLETELKRPQSGLIVGAHMVFKHIHHVIEGIDMIATMEKLYKIKVSCIGDSVAMTSFDAKMQKLSNTSQDSTGTGY